ncbi:MAG TPA: class I SAM-dependent methyltransferase [Candidatus Krumholzibacteria bacterium]
MTQPESDYSLLDSGNRRKLERFGTVVLDRPSPQALWAPRLMPSAWSAAAARYERSSSGGGSWERRSPLAQEWTVLLGELRFILKLTGFGHLGVFVEQMPFWEWIRARCAESESPLRVLNLFGYTGGSSLAAAAGGAEVAHCDSSKGIVQWGRANQDLNAMSELPIRWIVEDARKFVARELRRGSRYHAIVLDPPSFGRGQKGELFKLEEHLATLLDELRQLLTDDASFLLLSAHTPGIGALALRRLLQERLEERGGAFASGEMAIAEGSGTGLLLPSGQWAAWSCSGTTPPRLADGS